MVLTIDEKQYGKLLQRQLPRKVETAEDYDYWADLVEEIDMRDSSSPEERALGELMKIALEDYDRRRFPEEFLAAPLATLKHLMEANTMSQADLGRLLGISRSTASQIYNGQRGISKQVALKLAQRFGLDVRAFVA